MFLLFFKSKKYKFKYKFESTYLLRNHIHIFSKNCAKWPEKKLAKNQNLTYISVCPYLLHLFGYYFYVFFSHCFRFK